MPTYWRKQILTLGRFPEVVQKQKAEKTRKREEKQNKKRTMVIKMASYALQRHLGWCTQSRLGQQLFSLINITVPVVAIINDKCLHITILYSVLNMCTDVI